MIDNGCSRYLTSLSAALRPPSYYLAKKHIKMYYFLIIGERGRDIEWMKRLHL